VTAKQPAVKRYIVRLSADERERLNALIQKGKAPVRQVLKARILLKADASEAGEAWSDSQIAEALDTVLSQVSGRAAWGMLAGGDFLGASRCRSSSRAAILNGMSSCGVSAGTWRIRSATASSRK
jgi:hypothetical protein